MGTSRKSISATFQTLDLIESILFNEKNRSKFIGKMRSANIEESIKQLLLRENEMNLQVHLAPFLRAATVRHLRSGESQLVQSFREEYNTIYDQGGSTLDLQKYLDNQAKDGVWATDVEAAALGNLFDMTVELTEIVGKTEQTHTVNKSSHPEAPILRIYNSHNIHWFLEKEFANQTIGNGNCLYNAFALALRQIALFQEAQQKVNNDKLDISPKTKKIYKHVFEQQEQLQSALKKIKPLSIKTLIENIEKAKPEIARYEKSSRQRLFDDKSPLLPTSPRSPKISSPKKGVETDKFIPQNLTDSFAANLYDELAIMAGKTDELKKRSETNRAYKRAARIAGELMTELNKTAILYFNKNEISTEQFVNDSTAAINKARPALEKHRGWGQIIGNVALAIIGVGVGYLVAGLINKALTGNFLFFKTDSGEKLQRLEAEVKTNLRTVVKSKNKFKH